MHRLDVLGRVDLRSAEGIELRAVLAQPKRLALLAYLAIESCTGAVRRDQLLATFWPELDQEHARKALNKAVHFLRQELGEAALASRTADELAIDREWLTCDAVQYLKSISDGEDEVTVALYNGDLLPAFFIEKTPEFERWVDEKRASLRRAAGRAARRIAERHDREGDPLSALSFARRAVVWIDDEHDVRQLLRLLDKLGDRVGALQAYDAFARRMASDFESEPSAETRALIETIRSRNTVVASPSAPPTLGLPESAQLLRIAGQPARRRTALATIGAAALGVSVFVLAPRSAISYVADRVLVLPLQSSGVDSSQRVVIGRLLDALPTVIEREGLGHPVPSTQVHDLLAQTRGSPAHVADVMSRETAAGLQLRGICAPASSGTTCQVDILRMPARTLRMSVAVTGDPASAAFEAQLRERVLAALHFQRAFGDRANWAGSYIPASLSAARAFTAAFDRADWKLLDDAARLDTAWIEARAWQASNVPTTEESVLADLSNRLGLLEGNRDVIAYVRAIRVRDIESAFAASRRRFAFNPAFWIGMLAYNAEASGRPNTAVLVTRDADSLVPSDHRRLRTAKIRRGYALHHLARYEEQLQVARDMARLFSDDPMLTRTHEVMALAGLGRVDSVRALVAKWEAAPEPVTPMVAGTRAYVAGCELMAHGHPEVGREILRGALPTYRRLHETEGFRIEFFEILIELGLLDEARAIASADLRKAKTRDDSASLRLVLGAVAGRQGRMAEALEVDRYLERIAQPGEHPGDHLLERAVLAGYRGDRETAVRLLEQARKFGRAEHWFIHRDPAFAHMRDYPPFKRFLEPRD